MIRYFLSLAVYDHDPLRSHFAISLGTLSALAALFFGSETSMVYALAMQLHIDRKLRDFIHFLTYFASLLIIIPAIVNIIIIIKWRKPGSFQDFDRVIQGRCNWDVDAIWTGTGMSCSVKDAQPFGLWLGASIFRFAFTLVVVALYFFVSRYFPRPEEEPMPLPMEAGSQMDELTTADVSQRPDYLQTSRPGERLIYSPKKQRNFSFSNAGEALSRFEKPSGGDDAYDEEDSDVGHAATDSTYARVLTDEPDYLPGSSTLRQSSSSSSKRLSSKGSIQGPRPKPSLRSKSSSTTSTVTPDSPSLEVASQLQSLLDEVERDTEAAMLHHNQNHSRIQSLTKRPSIHMFGKSFDKLSIIESEDPESPLLYSPTITSHSSHRFSG